MCRKPSFTAIVMVILCVLLPIQAANAENIKVDLDESGGLPFHNGELLHITWRLAPTIPRTFSTRFNIRLLSIEPGRVVRNIRGLDVHIRDQEQWWRITPDIPEGEYAVYIGVGEPDTVGAWHRYSDWTRTFTILNRDLSRPRLRNLFPILNISPPDSPTRSIYPAGEAMAVDFQSECCNGYVEFTLRRGDYPDYRRLVGRVPYYCPARLDRYNWTIPQDQPAAEDYFLAAKLGGCYRMSETFRITPPIGDAGGLPGDSPYSIEIQSPRGGDLYYWGGDVWFQIFYRTNLPYTDTGDHSVKVAYMKSGEEAWSRGPLHYLHMRSPVTVYSDPAIFASGNDYKVRAELYLRDTSGFAEGSILMADDETGYFTIVNNTVSCSAAYPVVIRSPSTREGLATTFFVGEDIEIMWCSHPRDVGYVRIELVRDTRSGGGSREIIASASNADPRLTWTIPDDIVPGEGYRVRVEKLDGSAYNVNRWPFTIIRH